MPPQAIKEDHLQSSLFFRIFLNQQERFVGNHQVFLL